MPFADVYHQDEQAPFLFLLFAQGQS